MEIILTSYARRQCCHQRTLPGTAASCGVDDVQKKMKMYRESNILRYDLNVDKLPNEFKDSQSNIAICINLKN